MKKRSIALIVALFSVVFMVSPVGAAARYAAINIAYGIRLEFNEQVANLTDVNGKKVEPFVYNGTTYVPIRAVSELFGAEVGYDKNTNTAFVYDDFSEVCALFYSITTSAQFIMSTTDNNHDMATIWNDFSYYKKWNPDIYQRLNDLEKAIGKVKEDNVNASIVEEIIEDDFKQFEYQYPMVYNAFTVYEKTPNESTLKQLNDAILNLHGKMNTLIEDADEFFSDYCSWRNIGLPGIH